MSAATERSALPPDLARLLAEKDAEIAALREVIRASRHARGATEGGAEKADGKPLNGQEIDLPTGAKVALFHDLDEKTFYLRFTRAGRVTRLALSEEAMQAVVRLATNAGGPDADVWVLVDRSDAAK